MVFLLGIGLCLISLLIATKKSTSKNNAEISQAIFGSCILALLIILSVTTTKTYREQIEDLELVVLHNKNAEIYTEKFQTLEGDLKTYLAKNYPKYEKEIFDSISTKDGAILKFYFAQYPQLKASETILSLTQRLVDLQSDIFQQKLNKENALKRIRVRLRDILVIQWFIPTV